MKGEPDKTKNRLERNDYNKGFVNKNNNNLALIIKNPTNIMNDSIQKLITSELVNIKTMKANVDKSSNPTHLSFPFSNAGSHNHSYSHNANINVHINNKVNYIVNIKDYINENEASRSKLQNEYLKQNKIIEKSISSPLSPLREHQKRINISTSNKNIHKDKSFVNSIVVPIPKNLTLQNIPTLNKIASTQITEGTKKEKIQLILKMKDKVEILNSRRKVDLEKKRNEISEIKKDKNELKSELADIIDNLYFSKDSMVTSTNSLYKTEGSELTHIVHIKSLSYRDKLKLGIEDEKEIVDEEHDTEKMANYKYNTIEHTELTKKKHELKIYNKVSDELIDLQKKKRIINIISLNNKKSYCLNSFSSYKESNPKRELSNQNGKFND